MSKTKPKKQAGASGKPDRQSDFLKRRKKNSRIILAILLLLTALFYFLTISRFSG